MEYVYGFVWNSCEVRNFPTYLFVYMYVRKTLTYKCVWFGCGPQWRKNLYRENVRF